MFVLRTASATACTAVNGGATTISTSAASFTALRSSFTNRTASCTVLYIFQLPAMNGIRMGQVGLVATTQLCLILQRGDSGQRVAGQELERRAAARRNVRDPVGDAGLLHGGNRVAAADDRRALHVRDRARHGVGTRGAR